ncbi:hypothetical protein YC2023_082525 [Brassica napus]
MGVGKIKKRKERRRTASGSDTNAGPEKGAFLKPKSESWTRNTDNILTALIIDLIKSSLAFLASKKTSNSVTNAFETSSLVINPDGFDVQDYLRMAPNNELALSDGIREVVKPKGNKRQIEKWSTYPERSVLDIIMATEISLISADEEDNTCLSSTPVSKRRGDNDIDDLSSTSKKQCSKVIKVEKNIGN